MGGGVGLGTLGVTHGLGPDPAKPPPPPPGPSPAGQVTNADEREAFWERNRQTLRDWGSQQAYWWHARQAYWTEQRQLHEKHQRMRAELEKTSRATDEQRRIRAADLLYRFRPLDGPSGEPSSWLPPGPCWPTAWLTTSWPWPVRGPTVCEPTAREPAVVGMASV